MRSISSLFHNLQQQSSGLLNWLAQQRRKGKGPKRRLFRYPFEVEALEKRELLAAPPLPLWESIGPAPQTDPNGLSKGVGAVTGRISALAIASDYSSGAQKNYLY